MSTRQSQVTLFLVQNGFIESHAKAMSQTPRRIWMVLLGLFGAGAFIAISLVVVAVSYSLRAELNLQAFIRVTEATIEYIDKTQGNWPRSWEELASCNPDTDFRGFESRVYFDFQADPKKIIHQTSESFTAIQPHHPSYPVDWRAEGVIEALKSFHGENAIPTYSAESFRAVLTTLISEKRYHAAVAYLRNANPELQTEFDQTGFLAVAQEDIYLPGVDSDIHFDCGRDWEFPGTSDVVENIEWQKSATEFATRYNQHRQGK